MKQATKPYPGFSKDRYFPDAYWNRRTPAGPLDIVKLSEADLINGSNGLLGKPTDFWRLIDAPALQQFSLHINASLEDSDTEFRFDYEQLPGNMAPEESDNGITCNLKIACRLSLRWPDKPYWTPFIGMLLGVMHNPAKGGKEPTVKFEWMREGDVDNDLVEILKTHMRHAVNNYIRVQAILLNRPEVFRTASGPETRPEKDAPNRPNTNRKRKVKLCRTIVIDRDKIQPASVHRHSEILCPCWGVIGHVRHYKSGKEAWIKPYVKGKARHNKDLYSAKQYEIMKGADEACEI